MIEKASAKLYPIPANEEQRLTALDLYGIVDTPPEPEFDHIAQLAAEIFSAPMALISFVGKDRQSFKARVGVDLCDTSRASSFCAHSLMQDEVLVVPDAMRDLRFMQNPLVIGPPFIRFYAGAPLVTENGYTLGSVCIIDTEVRPPLTDQEQRLLKGLARVTMDHLERRRLGILKRAFLRMAAATSDAIICCNDDSGITFWNASAESIFGYMSGDVMGRRLDAILPDLRSAFRNEREQGPIEREPGPASRFVEMSGVRKDESRFPAEVSITYWHDGVRRQFGAIVRDVSQRHRAQEQLRFLTHFDRLTALPNRTRFIEKIEEELRQGNSFAMFKLGLDKFKSVNGSLGLGAGDFVLKTAADRMVQNAGPEAFVARLGSDEFGVLLSGETDRQRLEALGQHLVSAISQEFQIGSTLCHLTASIGIVIADEHCQFEHADGVLNGGLLALHQAKKAGGRRCEIFRPYLGRQAVERRILEEDLHLALARGEFELHFQPQLRVDTLAVVGAEALLRWRHPDRGLLPPSAFLSTLETSNIANDVGTWILNQACALAAEFAHTETPVRVGINLFGIQLRDDNLFSSVNVALARHGLPAHLLELEITETTVLGLDESVINALRNLRNLGVGIAFDDYGTGFASLSLLKRYPLTRLKIDVEFVRGILLDPDDAAIVRAVLALGRSMGFHVIAEGVESEDQLQKLACFGCEEAQGFLFGRAMPAADFRAFVHNHAGANSWPNISRKVAG